MGETAILNTVEEISGINEGLNLACTGLHAEMIRYQNLKDLRGVLNCIHKESMSRFTSKQLLEPLFNLFTMNNTIVSHIYVGTDGEYIYYRFKQKIEKIAGPDFKNMLGENFVLFKRQDGEWKVWGQLVLMMQPI